MTSFDSIGSDVQEQLMMQKEAILSSAFRLAVIAVEGLDAQGYMLDADTVLQYGRCVINHEGSETFFYKDQPVITFYRAEIRNSAKEHHYIFEQRYKVHTV
jgi:hypothetical protein